MTMMTQDTLPTITISFHVMRKAAQGRVLHAVAPTVKGWGKAICGAKTGTKWEPGPPDSVVTCSQCLYRLGVRAVGSER